MSTGYTDFSNSADSVWVGKVGPDFGGYYKLADMTEKQLSIILKNTTTRKEFVTKYTDGMSHELQDRAAFYRYMIEIS